MIITLCGSTKFKRQYEYANRELTMLGIIVISVGLFGHTDNYSLDKQEKTMLDELHLKKIDLSDAIVVINPEGYIGKSTRNEIDYAHKNNRKVFYYYGENGHRAPIALLNILKQLLKNNGG